jgi:hypothetical protein
MVRSYGASIIYCRYVLPTVRSYGAENLYLTPGVVACDVGLYVDEMVKPVR